MRQYISYRYKWNNNTMTDRSSPSTIFPMMFAEMKGVVTITDELLTDEQMKVLPNGEKSWVRIGWVEVDEAMLASFWHNVEYVKEELLNNNTIKIYLETKETLATFLRTYTTVREEKTNVFVLREKTELSEAIILDLN